jgi:predicted phage terminase large subunit-like protein
LVKKGGLRYFMPLAWPHIEGSKQFIPNWHIDAIADHLQAVSRGEIRRLAISMPPRHFKSSAVVMWLAWDWIEAPWRQFLFSSYAHNLSIRDGVRSRRIIQSGWYRNTFGDSFKLVGDQNTKIRFDNDKQGYRIATSVDGQLTGEGGDIIVCFSGGTQVETPDGPVTIEHIYRNGIGPYVRSYDFLKKKRCWGRVTSVTRNPGRPLVRINTTGGRFLRVTEDHLVFVVGRGFTPAAFLRPGEEVIQISDRERDYVRSVAREPSEMFVYDLKIEEYRCLFANGVLAHNCDDPNNVREAESEAIREATNQWWDESMSTRLNSANGSFVLIQQRVHQRDLTGHIMSRERDRWTYLCLPARYEPDHPYVFLGDKRTEAGEPLWKARFNDEYLKDLETSLGSYAGAAQLQQRPSPREGGMFKRAWFQVVDAVPAEKEDTVRRWDLAATADTVSSDPDYTAHVRMTKLRDGRYVIEHADRMRVSSGQVEAAMKAMASQDGPRVRIVIPQDPGQAGVAQVNYLTRQLAGYVIRAEKESGAKDVRANPFAAQCEAGNVLLLRGQWNDAFLEELTMFPNGAHDDFVDAAAGAFNALTSANIGLIEWYRQEAQAHQEKLRKEAGHAAVAG